MQYHFISDTSFYYFNCAHFLPGILEAYLFMEVLPNFIFLMS